MPNTDLPGDDYNVTNVNYADPHICQAACTADPKCLAYTYVTRPPLVGSCCLKNGYPAENPNQPTCTSGVKPGGPPPSTGTPLPLLPGDTAIDVHVFLDNTFAEIYLMEGRLAITVSLGSAPISDAGISLFAGAGAGVTATGVNVWGVRPIWTSTENVLAAAAAKKSKATVAAIH